MKKKSESDAGKETEARLSQALRALEFYARASVRRFEGDAGKKARAALKKGKKSVPLLDKELKALLKKERGMLERSFEPVVDAILFYANPESYHAISVLADPPAGEFAEDFDEAPESDYGRPMPGKKARQAIKLFNERIKIEREIANGSEKGSSGAKRV